MLESAKKHLRIYQKFFLMYFKTILVYKTDFLLGVVNQVFSFVSSLALIALIFTQIDYINGWSFYELVIVYGIGRMVIYGFHLFCFNIVFLGEAYIINGKLDRLFLRPLNILFQVFASRVNFHNLSDIVASTIMVLYASYQIQVSVITLPNILYLLMAIPSAIMVVAAVILVFATMGFWIGPTKSLVNLFWKFRRFGRFPYGIYSLPLRVFFVTAMPIMFVSFFPASFILNRPEWVEYQALTLFIGPLLFLLAYRFWLYGLSKYSSTGS